MKIKVVIFQEQDKYICQAIDVDICTQGDTKEEAIQRLKKTFKVETNHGLIDVIPPAPGYFAEIWQTNGEYILV